MALILIGSLVILVGLLLVIPQDTLTATIDRQGLLPCFSPFYKIVYGISNLIGYGVVLGSAIFLSIKVHWWYFLIFFVGTIINRPIVWIIRLLSRPIYSRPPLSKISMLEYWPLYVDRTNGILLIWAGLICLLIGYFNF